MCWMHTIYVPYQRLLGSAGGLSTFLHLDRIADVLSHENPSCKVRGAPVVGYFLDHANFAHTNSSYTDRMHYSA